MSEKRLFYSLKEEVIDPGFCVLCGACSAFCDRIELDYKKGTPELVNPCVIGCSNCYDHCPVRVDFNANQVFGKTTRDSVLGPYMEIKAVKALNEGIMKNAQDGGAVTAILSAILDRGKIDATVIVERDSEWKPIPRVITSKEELLGSMGSKYSPSPNAEVLGQVFREMNIKSVAIVDVGCHIRALRNLEYDLLYNIGFSPYSDLKIYTIGLFCSGSFLHKGLFNLIKKNPKSIKKMDINRGKFTIQSNVEESLPVKKLEGAFMPSCPMCKDYSAELADLSIGSIGTPDGYSTVIARDLMGWGMLRDAVQKGYVEADESLVDLDGLRTAVSRKKKRAGKRILQIQNEKKLIPGFIQ
jgi:coenzyme F420 hydrogenase subunit beta